MTTKMSVDKSHPSMQLMCRTCQHEELAGDVWPCSGCWNPAGDNYRAKLQAPEPPAAPPPGYVTIQDHMAKVRQDPAKAAALDRARVRLAAAWAARDHKLIDAAEKHAQLYHDQPALAPVDLVNAYYAGAYFQRKAMLPQPGDVRLLLNLIGDYYALGVAEGQEGRTHDTPDNAAQRTWSEIQEAIFRLSANQKPPAAA